MTRQLALHFYTYLLITGASLTLMGDLAWLGITLALANLAIRSHRVVTDGGST